MLLVSYGRRTPASLGLMHQGRVYAVAEVCRHSDDVQSWGRSILAAIENWTVARPHLEQALARIGEGKEGMGIPIARVGLLAPIPLPIRDPMCVAGNYQAHVDRAQAQTGIPLNERRSAFFFTKAGGATSQRKPPWIMFSASLS